MEQKHIEYLKKIGIDLLDLSHPICKEYHEILSTKNPDFIGCFEHLLKNLILDTLFIKQHSIEDYSNYINKLNKKDISFWGERFEISWYAALIKRIKNPIKDIRRGKAGIEADFIFQFENETFGIETTSLTFSQKSKKSDPISKIIDCIKIKENKIYASKNCILIIDISNLMFYRKVLNNFSNTIEGLSKQIESKYGAILFSEGYHIIEENKRQYGTRIYSLIQKGIPKKLEDFITQNSSPISDDNSSETTLFFKNA